MARRPSRRRRVQRETSDFARVALLRPRTLLPDLRLFSDRRSEPFGARQGGLFSWSAGIVPASPAKRRMASVSRSNPFQLAFREPKNVFVCIRRHRRREVMFALKQAGKGARARRRRRNDDSNYRCYQDRYDHMRRSESRVSGEFKSSTLNFWHFAREFGSAPALNADFVKCVPTERTFAVPSQDVYYVNVKHSIQARRLVSPTGSSFTF